MRDDLSHRGAALIRYLIIYLIDDKLGAFQAGEAQGYVVVRWNAQRTRVAGGAVAPPLVQDERY